MKTLMRLIEFLRPFAGEICLSILVGIATIGSGIGMLGTSAYLITFAALHPSIAELQVAIVGVRFFGISRSGFRYLERLVSHSVNLKVLANIRGWFYRKIEPLAPAGLQEYHSGDLLDRVMADIETLQDFYVRVVSPFIVAVVVTIGLSLVLGGYAVILGWILFAGMFLNGFVLPAIFMLVSRSNSAEMLVNRSVMSRYMLEYFQGLEDLQASVAHHQWMQKIQTSSDQFSSSQQKSGIITGFNDALILLVSGGTALAILAEAIPLVVNGWISGISLAVVVMLTMAGFEAANPLPLAAQNLMASLAAARRLFEVADGKPVNLEIKQTIPINTDIYRVEFKNVEFSYPNSSETVLKEINLHLEKGKKVALIGPSGAGKTTLIELLLGFWEPQKGELVFSSKDREFRNPLQQGDVFGVIAQNSYLFSESLRNNLLMAKPSATDIELIKVLNQVGLQNWFTSLPQGLDTWLGERGQQMSGGERQRLAVARTLICNSPFVILDEPTSHLDTGTARSMIKNAFSLLTGKGILLATHQMDLLDEMDMIHFIKDGKIIESGTKVELLKHRGDFYRFNQLQSDLLTI